MIWPCKPKQSDPTPPRHGARPSLYAPMRLPPPPMPMVSAAHAYLPDAIHALRRGLDAWNPTQLKDALRSAEHFLQAAKNALGSVSTQGTGDPEPVGAEVLIHLKNLERAIKEEKRALIEEHSNIIAQLESQIEALTAAGIVTQLKAAQEHKTPAEPDLQHANINPPPSYAKPPPPPAPPRPNTKEDTHG